MARITGMGGYFLRSDDPEQLMEWYRDVLRLGVDGNGAWAQDAGTAVFAPMPRDSEYFPAAQSTMLNLRVDDLDGLLEELRSAGVAVVDERFEADGVGKFGWLIDPEGNRVELWEPPTGDRIADVTT